MDIQAQLAKSIQQILSSTKGNTIPSTPKAEHAIVHPQKSIDQFNKNRTDLLKELGTYTRNNSLNTVLGLNERQSSIFRELSQQIHLSLNSNLSLLLTQNQSEGYLTALLIQSFGWLDKKIKREKKRTSFQSQPDKKNKKQRKTGEESSDKEAASYGERLLEALLVHTESHGTDSEFLFWAWESLKQTQAQLNFHQIEMTDQTQNLFSIAFEAIEALKSGMSVKQIRAILQQTYSPKNSS